MRYSRALAALAAALFLTRGAAAQSNSLFKEGKVAKPGEDSVRTTSLLRVTTSSERVFNKHDLISIIVREQTQSKTVADAETDKTTNVKANVDAWPRFTKGGVVEDASPAQAEILKIKAERAFEGGGSKRRDDLFVARITAEIVDVKPNGTLVLEATKTRQWMGETQVLTITGIVRREDVSADNTVTSENVANLCLSYETRGQVADAARRGFVDRVLDFLNIF